MANNRMYMVDDATGEKLYIGKYYPGTGYYAPDNIDEKLAQFFDQTSIGKGMTGPRYRLEFEIDPDAKGLGQYMREKLQATA